MKDRSFGSAGDRVIIEECLEGEEASFIAFTDGRHVLPLASSQDHKAIFDNDLGPNTGGMGAYSPAPVVTPDVHERIMNEIMIPTVRAMESEGSPILGLSLRRSHDQKMVFPEFWNSIARMGDPEAQPLLFRMKSDMVRLMMEALEGNLGNQTIEWIPDDAVCVVMASGGYPGSYEKGKPITGIETGGRSLQASKFFHAGTAEGPNGVVTSRR